MSTPPNPKPPKPIEDQRGGIDPTTPGLDLNPRSLAATLTAHQRNTTGKDYVLDGTTTTYMPPQPGPDEPGALVNLGSLDRTTTPPAWHADATPPAVAAALAKFGPEMDRLMELDDDAAALDAADAHDLREYERTVDAAVAAGEPVPKFEPVDRSAERIAVRSEANSRLRRLRTLRRQYDALVVEHAPEWRARLVADYGPLVPTAAAAFAAFERAWKAWRSRTATIARLNKIVDGTWENPGHDHRKADLYKKANEGMAAIAGILGSSNPSVNGSHVCDPLGIVPPANVRRDWDTQSVEHRRLLGEVEAAEGYRITDYTRPAGWKPPADPAPAAEADATVEADVAMPAAGKAKAKSGKADADAGAGPSR